MHIMRKTDSDTDRGIIIFLLYFYQFLTKILHLDLVVFYLKMTDFQFLYFPLKRVGGPYVGAGPFSAHN